MKNPFAQELIAPCGMNCGICSAFLRDKKTCHGCRTRDMKCGIKNCEKFQENKFNFCYECDSYPCVRIKRLDKRYRTRYNMSMIENLEFIKQKSIPKFIENERIRWKCSECGGVVCVHNKICYNCGKGIPVTGRIGRFARILKKETTEDVFVKIMQGSDRYATFSSAKKAEWWREAMVRLENELGRDKAIKIMQSCGQKCCGETYRKIAKKYWQESKNLKEFVNKLNDYFFKDQATGIAGGRLKIKDAHTITGGYDKCYCGQVNNTTEPFPTDIYCHCGTGWLKMLFESVFEKPVEVEMTQSVINGADTCEFIIHL